MDQDRRIGELEQALASLLEIFEVTPARTVVENDKGESITLSEDDEAIVERAVGALYGHDEEEEDE